MQISINKPETACCAPTAGIRILNQEAPPITNPYNTLTYAPGKCINCKLCISVCPHAVFSMGERVVQLTNADACMECGACQINCPTGAILVDSGVGCAAAMISAALRGSDDITCGGDDNSCC